MMRTLGSAVWPLDFSGSYRVNEEPGIVSALVILNSLRSIANHVVIFSREKNLMSAFGAR
jgi:hypothetical protein